MREECEEKLKSVHPDLVSVLCKVQETSEPFVVVRGYVDEDEQAFLFSKRQSAHRYGQSSHNQIPALGVDIQPEHWNVSDRRRMAVLLQNVLNVSKDLGVRVRVRGFSPVTGQISGHVELVL